MQNQMFFTTKSDETGSFTRFTFEPLRQSFGQSMGNALRRTLLSSLRGTAVSFVKMEGIAHLFTPIKGVKESALDIVLSLKQLRFKVGNEGSFKIQLSAKGKGKIYGKDIEGEAEVVNGDQYIAEITDDKGKLELEALVETGYGFVPSEEKEVKETGFIAIDSSYSPVTKVSFKVEEARVGRKTNYDRLIIEVWTDGSISPSDALKQASTLMSEQFSHILSGQDVVQEKSEETKELEQAAVDPKLYEIIIDELNLPSRVINALLRENIETVADLVKTGREKLVGLKGVGRKSIDLIDEELKKMGIELN